jgi:hypothetical protein
MDLKVWINFIHVLFVADRTGERKKMDGSEETESKHRKS